MSLTTVTHLNFHGEAREALEFYQSVFGGEVTIATYGDFGMPKELPDADKVVWGQVAADNGFRVMAYDVPADPRRAQADASTVGSMPSTRRENGMTLTSEKFFLSVRGESLDEVSALWERLSDGATTIEKLGPSRWAPGFGMLTDRFGVTWVLDVAAGQSGA
jgi:PhnB protein